MASLTKQLEREGPFPVSGDVDAAKQRWLEYRRANGYAGLAPLLTPPEGNLKLHKTGFAGQMATVYGLTLAPADASGIDLCIWRTPQCTSACVLVTAGKSTLPSVRKARIVKSLFLAEHPQDFVLLLADELRRAVKKHGSIAARLNVASDLRWERIAPQLFELEGIAFYDYTKAPASQRDDLGGKYHLTFSVSEKARSETEALRYLDSGGTAAVVFDTKRGAELPATWHGYPVIDGDLTDARHEDLPSVVVGLRAKGSGRKLETGGFVKAGVAS